MTWRVRPWRMSDRAGCVDVSLDAILNGTAPHYSEAQRRAWAAPASDHADWTGRLATGPSFVAEDDAGLLGFVTLTTAGHLDLFFVRPGARPQGVASALYDSVLDAARGLGLGRLTTDASRLARPFLEKRGWQVTGRECATRNGVPLERFGMALDGV